MSFFLHKNLPWPLLIPQKSAILGDPSFPKRGIKRGALPKMVIKEGYSNKPMELIFFSSRTVALLRYCNLFYYFNGYGTILLMD